MKNLLWCLFLTSICLLPHVHPSATGDYWVSIEHAKTPVQVAGQADQKQEAKKEEQKNMEPSVTGDLSSVLTRALSSDPVGKGSTANAAALAVLAKNQVRFTKSAYASGTQGNTLYLGAENLGVVKDLAGNITKSFVLGTDKKNFALSSAVLGFNSSGAFAPITQSLAPNKVAINGEKDQDNPLVRVGTNITNLTLQNGLPVLTAQARDDMNKLVIL